MDFMHNALRLVFVECHHEVESHQKIGCMFDARMTMLLKYVNFGRSCRLLTDDAT